MNFPVICCLAYPDIAGTVVVLSDGTTRTYVSDLNVGTWTTNPQTVTLPGGEPAGTIFMAFTENSDGSLALVTPWSSSLATTTPVGTPEPSSIMLLSAGLFGLLALKRAIA
jgi:hypothetical protein